MSITTVTRHAKDRMKERIGIPKKACQRDSDNAYENGHCHKDARGRVKRYLDSLFFLHKTANALRVKGLFVYIFNRKTLITVVHLPEGMANGFK